MKNILFILLFVSLYSVGQIYQPMTYTFNGTPTNGVKIKTNMPFSPSNYMPTVIIEGYNFGTSESINLMINYYIYSDSGTPASWENPANFYFSQSNASSSGSYAPTIKLANENSKVVIYIDSKDYYQRFMVRAFGQGMSEQAAWFQGWTTADEPLTGTKQVIVPYKNKFKDEVLLNGTVNIKPKDGNWTSSLNFRNPTNDNQFNLTSDINGRLSMGYNQSGFLTFSSAGSMAIGSYNTSGNRGDISLTGDFIFNNADGQPKNGWIIHTPNDNRKTLFIAPTNYVTDGWNWDKATNFDENGNVSFAGNITRAGQNVLYGNAGDNYGNLRVLQNISSANQDGLYLNFNSTGGSAAHLRFYANGTTERMRIDASTGNVGIGTAEPGTFKLAVNGNIKAKEVKVSTLNWADFVFANEYQLPTLSAVEKFIKANKHLPEIPSEKEVKEKGIDLGEMNVKLLQKIEELTLYLIEQGKKNDVQSEQIFQLEKTVNELKTLVRK